MEIPVYILLVLMSSVYLYVIVSINHKWGARAEMRDINKQMKELQKEMSEAEKRNDKVKLSQIQAKQVDIMGRMSKTMFKSMVPMIIILPVAAVLFGHIGSAYGDVFFKLPFGIPILHESNIWSAVEFVILILFVMGLLVNTLFYKAVEKLNLKKEVN